MAAPQLPSQVDILKTDAAAKKGLGVKAKDTEAIWPKPQFSAGTVIDNVTDGDGASGFIVPAGSMFTLGAAIPATTVLSHGMYFPAGTMFPNGVLVPIHQRMVSCQPLKTSKPSAPPPEPSSDNIDPSGKASDAVLNDALSLIHSSPSANISIRGKFRLETEVASDGSNFSAGEKQLLWLICTLVRGCKILVLDEATSSVDPETDALIQKIIQTEFSHVTTVAYYDRILVMDAGRVAEYASPLELFDRPDSIFRSLCDVKGLTRQNLLESRAAASTGRA